MAIRKKFTPKSYLTMSKPQISKNHEVRKILILRTSKVVNNYLKESYFFLYSFSLQIVKNFMIGEVCKD